MCKVIHAFVRMLGMLTKHLHGDIEFVGVQRATGVWSTSRVIVCGLGIRSYLAWLQAQAGKKERSNS